MNKFIRHSIGYLLIFISIFILSIGVFFNLTIILFFIGNYFFKKGKIVLNKGKEMILEK